MKILGLDFGKKKVGLAVSDPLGKLSSTRGIITYKAKKDLLRKIRDICQEENVEKVILGFPASSEKESSWSKEVLKFGKDLERVLKKKVVFWDETFTSKKAIKKMIEAGKPQKKRKKEDAFAAALILQEYLDSHGKD